MNFSSPVLPIGGYTEKNHNDADVYARNKLLQQQIRSLVASEPLNYAFVEISNKGIDGWKSLGIEVERGQALTPFYKITYNLKTLDCSRFSCLPIDIRDNKSLKSCHFRKTPAIEVNFGMSNQETYTACGEACYTFNKKMDPHTGLPKAAGNLMKQDKNGICNYINQGLLLWGTYPQSRVTKTGDIINGYNDEFVPPFAVVDNSMYNELEITDAYCQYFKRWFDSKEKQCYRTGWMKCLHFAFGTAISNVFYSQNTNLIERAKSKLTTRELKFKQPNIEKIFGAPLERKKANESDEVMAERLYNNHYGTSNSSPTSIASILATTLTTSSPSSSSLSPSVNSIKDNFNKKQEILDLIKNIIRKKENNSYKYDDNNIEEQAEDIMGILFELAFNSKLHKINDSKIRKIFLSKILKYTKKNKNNFNDYLKLIPVYFKIKDIIFSNNNNDNNNNNNNNIFFKNKDDLIMFVEDRYGFDNSNTTEKLSRIQNEKPAYIIQIIKKINETCEKDKIPLPFMPILKISYIQDKLKDIAINLWTDLHDLFSPQWERYNDDFSYTNNFFVIILMDNIIHKSLALMSKACMNMVQKLSVDMIENLAGRTALMAEDALLTIFSRVVISSAERLAVNVLIRGAVTMALQIFARLLTLVAGILDGIGIIFLIGGILGLILDLALHTAWYENVMTPEILKLHVKNYVNAFKSATDLTIGEIAPVTPQELIEVAITCEAEGLDKDDPEIHDDNSFTNFLNKYFEETPLTNSKTDIFIQNSYFEYLGTKTMNSLGQPLGRGKSNIDQNPISTYFQGGKEKITKLINKGAKYTNVVSYNAPRIMAYDIQKKEDKHHYTNLSNIVNKQKKSKLLTLLAGIVILIGSTCFIFCYRGKAWINDITTFLFIMSLIIYLVLMFMSCNILIETNNIVKDFIFSSKLFNMNDQDIINYKDIEKLRGNSESIRFYFSEFTKPYTQFLLAQ
nr:MAG: wsv115-like protein [Metapenaeopsis lamellata majanivirus]